MGFNKYEYDTQYRKDHFKRVPLDMPIEEYEAMKLRMDEIGYKKVNSYIRELIAKDINCSKSISVGNINQQGNNNSINIG